MSDPASSAHGVAIKVRNVHKHFGPKHVLRGVDLDVEPGEIFVIMGGSGSGKSVLLKHIIGLEEADESPVGEVLVDGRPVTVLAGRNDIEDEFGDDDCRVAMVFQSGALLNSLTVGENVGLYLAEHRLKKPAEIREIVREKLQIVGLTEAEDQRTDQLSGGMKRRVALARALVMEPNLMLYDEPTSELDPLTSITIGKEIRHMRDETGVTSVVVTHDRDLALGIGDRIALMVDGKLLPPGTPEEIQNSSDPTIRRFLDADFSTYKS